MFSTDETDELELPVIRAQHAAYGDTQTCYIQLSATLPDTNLVDIQYRDDETLCKGVLNLATTTLTGTVHQLVSGQEGFEFPSDEETNTFVLTLDPHSPELLSAKRTIAHTEIVRTGALVAWAEMASRHPLNQAGEAELAKSEDAIIATVDHAVQKCEDLCSKMRRQTAILNELSFSTLEERHSTLELIKARGLNRVSIHADQSEAEIRVFALIRAYQRCLDCRLFQPVEEKHRHLRNQCYKFRSRLILNFQKLDTAIRAAEIRVPQSELQRFKRIVTIGTEPSEACTVCMCEIEAGEECLDLPCGHSFHVECCTSWLHWNASCPNCRQAIEAGANSAAADRGAAGAAATAAGTAAATKQ